MLNKSDYDYGTFSTQFIIIMTGIFIYPVVCVSIVALLILGWVVILTFTLIILLFAAIVLLFSCGKLNLFNRIIPFIRRRRQDAQSLLRMYRPKQLDLEKLAKDTSKKWADHKAIIK